MKYKCSEIVNYARSLADLKDVNFITWGDAVRMLNISYKKVYQDIINNGDLSYLKEEKLIINHDGLYELPEDYYQLAMINNEYGQEIPKLQLSYSTSDYGYIIRNNTIYFQNVNGTISFKYYPSPDTITYKMPQRFLSAYASAAIVSAFDDKYLTSDGYLAYVSGSSAFHLPDGTVSADCLLGKDSFCRVSSGVVYNTRGAAIDNVLHPLLTSAGYFVSNDVGYGWCNDDATVKFVVYDNKLYCNDEVIADDLSLLGSNVYSARVIYYNGKFALLTCKAIVYEDGSYETTDVQIAKAVLKGDMDTGYGYLSSISSGYVYQAIVIGWAPETLVDFPNNILFELSAYDLAIQFRSKQFADTTQLEQAYHRVEEAYWKTLPQDQDSYVTIRNVNKQYSKWRMF